MSGLKVTRQSDASDQNMHDESTTDDEGGSARDNEVPEPVREPVAAGIPKHAPISNVVNLLHNDREYILRVCADLRYFLTQGEGDGSFHARLKNLCKSRMCEEDAKLKTNLPGNIELPKCQYVKMSDTDFWKAAHDSWNHNLPPLLKTNVNVPLCMLSTLLWGQHFPEDTEPGREQLSVLRGFVETSSEGPMAKSKVRSVKKNSGFHNLLPCSRKHVMRLILSLSGASKRVLDILEFGYRAVSSYEKCKQLREACEIRSHYEACASFVQAKLYSSRAHKSYSSISAPPLISLD